MAALAAAGLQGASACNVPVFRYALERWPPGEHIVRLAQGIELPEEGEHDENLSEIALGIFFASQAYYRMIQERGVTDA